MWKIVFLISLLISVSSVAMAADLNNTEIVNNVVKNAGSIQSYRTVLSLTDFNQPAEDRKDFTIQWQAEYVKPDRFSVAQSAWDKKENLYDRWISIGEDAYYQIGSWFKSDNGANKKLMNQNLVPDKWVHLIQDSKILSVKNEGNVITIEIAPMTLRSFHLNDLTKTTICNAKIEIDPASFYIVKGLLKVQGENGSVRADMIFEQTFSDYNTKIIIEKPAEVMDLGKK